MEQGRIASLREQSRRRLGGEPEVFETPFVVLASPSWRGVEADLRLSSRGSHAEMIKAYHAETDFYIDVPASMHAAAMAGELDVGPTIVEQSAEDGVMVMQYLGEGWRTAGLHDAARPRVRAAIIAAKKRFQTAPSCLTDADTFAQIRGLAAMVRGSNLIAWPRIAAGLALAEDIEARIRAAGIDRLPCHRDGNVSNVLIGLEDEVRLLDYDMAANADPFEDLGCFLTEMYDDDAPARAGFEEWTGSFHEGRYLRALAYGVVDDLRWGLIATAMTIRSRRRSLEFGKYAAWRLMRFEDRAGAGLMDRLHDLA